MRSLVNAKISGFRLWIIPEPLVPRQEDRRLGERDCDSIESTVVLFSGPFKSSSIIDKAL